MANTSISNLSAGAAVSATDLVPNVQTVGVGPVKTTAAQLKTFMSASPALVTPALGTPSSGDFSTGTFTWPTFNQNTSGTAAGLSATLAVTSGGTGTATAFTSGSIVFAGASGVYSQNNTGLFFNTASSLLGIGTASPAHTLHVFAASANMNIQSSNTAGGYLTLTRGTGAFPASGALALSQFNGSAFLKNLDTGSISITTTSSDTTRLTISNAGNIYAPAGATSMTNGFIYIPSAAGAPTGAATAVSGNVPMYYDTTDNKFYVYNGSWKSVVLT